jgi:WD40 repeat protein
VGLPRSGPPPLLRAARFAVGAHGVAVLGTSDAMAVPRLFFWDGLSGLVYGMDDSAAMSDRLATSSDGRFFVSALEDGTLRVGSVVERKVTGLRAMARAPSALAISDKGEWIAAGDANGQIYLWKAGSDSARIFKAQSGIVAVSFSAAHGLLAYADDKGVTTIRRLDSGDKLADVQTNSAARMLAFGDADLLAIAAETLRIVNVSSGRVVAEREYDGEIRDMVMGPSGQPLYYAIGNAVHVWPWDWNANIAEACKRAGRVLNGGEKTRFGLDLGAQDPCSGRR